MTEIEKQAEIYTKEKHCKNGCRNIPNCWENDIEDCCIDCRKTNEDFIAGAKWGMEHAIKWHDLRKNPSDLPEVNKLVLLIVWASVRVIGWYDGKKFIMDVNGRMFEKEDENIIAWCELPQFKDKE